MTRKLLLFAILISGLGAIAQNGYEIQVTLKPFKDQYIYLGHYFGKTYPIVDSVKLDANSKGIFKGSKKLPGGIYLIGYPNKSGFFEILVDKEQRFSIEADTATIAQNIRFVNSKDNVDFLKYQQTMRDLGIRMRNLQQQAKSTTNKTDSIRLREQIIETDRSINAYREDLIKNQSNTLLGALMQCMREPVLPENLKRPTNAVDSLAAYRYFKEHYWEGTNFWDGRLAYTTFFDEKLDRYFKQMVAPDPDSVIREIDYMLAFAQADPEMNRFLLIKFINRYLNQQYMWEDAIFVHLYEKYLSNKAYPWLDEKGKKLVQDRAYSLMANILGTQASDIFLPNVKGQIQSLYSVEAPYTLVVFWDPTCGHCKETLPRVDSIYFKKWRGLGLQVYSVAKETSGTISDWFDFINRNQLNSWVNVYYSKSQEQSMVEDGRPGYSQLYDIVTFPTIYLLDSAKRIKAKKLTIEQIDELLRVLRPEEYAKSSEVNKPPTSIASGSKSKGINVTNSPANGASGDIKSDQNSSSETVSRLGMSDDFYDAFGSGIMIDVGEGLVLTNYHVVENATAINLKFYFERQKKPVETFGELIGFDEFNDLALIKIQSKLSLPNVSFKILNRQDSVARKVYALGYPRISVLGGELKVTDGIISSLSGYEGDSRFYQISAAIAPGSSGGPTFSENGSLIGINSEGIIAKSIAENVGYSIKSTTIAAFLKNLGIIPKSISEFDQRGNKSAISMLADYSKYVPLIRVKY